MDASIIAAGIIAGSVIGSSFAISRRLKKIEDGLFYAIIKHALVSNFSRFSQLDEASIAVIDQHAYYVQNGTLWIADYLDDDMVMQSARPVDLVEADSLLLREAMMAVDVLNNVVSGKMEDEEEEEED
jgi:hypothetical protein